MPSRRSRRCPQHSWAPVRENGKGIPYTACTCDACRNIGNLTLKFIVHHGSFVRQTVGGRPQVAGADVVLAHKLLKNAINDTRAYMLLTEPAAHRMAVADGTPGLRRHTERYEAPDLAVPLAAAWEWVLGPERRAQDVKGLRPITKDPAHRPGIGTRTRCSDGSRSSPLPLPASPGGSVSSREERPRRSRARSGPILPVCSACSRPTPAHDRKLGRFTASVKD